MFKYQNGQSAFFFIQKLCLQMSRKNFCKFCHVTTIQSPPSAMPMVAKTPAEKMQKHGGWCLLRPVGGGGVGTHTTIGSKTECSGKG